MNSIENKELELLTVLNNHLNSEIEKEVPADKQFEIKQTIDRIVKRTFNHLGKIIVIEQKEKVTLTDLQWQMRQIETCEQWTKKQIKTYWKLKKLYHLQEANKI